MEENDEIDFRPVKDLLRQNVRRPVEPGVWRSLVIAMIVGIGMGLFVYYFKPGPKPAEAAPRFGPQMMNVQTVPQSGKGDLFELPEWDEAAYQRDRLKTK